MLTITSHDDDNNNNDNDSGGEGNDNDSVFYACDWGSSFYVILSLTLFFLLVK